MARKALLFGLNYLGDPRSSLGGCINDAKNLYQLLRDHLGFREQDMLVCTDETSLKPTKSVMIRLLTELALWTWTHPQPVKQVFISYSGHGSYQVDRSTEEADGRDEVLIPLDYQQQGVITDDDLSKIVRSIHPATDVILLIDACHSGTVLDLPFRYVSGNKYVIENDSSMPSRVICISGCADDQYSEEVPAWNGGRGSVGLMTSSFIHALEQHEYDVTCWRLIKYMQEFIGKMQVPQKPQLCTSRKLSETCIFVTSNVNGVAFLTTSQEKK